MNAPTTTRPNFLIAGAARSGTTALAQALAAHPEVFLTDPKEMHFYAHARTEPSYGGIDDDLLMNDRVISDPDRFYALFEGAEGYARRGDGSVSTLFFPEASIPNIRRYAAPDTKVIVVLREPVQRAYSSYLYLRGRGHEPLDDFEAALSAEDERAAANYHHMWLYRRASEYERQLRPFVEAFGDHLAVFLHEELATERDRVLTRAARFLGVDDSYAFPESTSVNRGGQPRSALLPRLLNALRERPGMLRAGKAIVPRRLIESVKQVNLVRPELSAETAAALRERLAPDVRYVEALMGADRLRRWREPDSAGP